MAPGRMSSLKLDCPRGVRVHCADDDAPPRLLRHCAVNEVEAFVDAYRFARLLPVVVGSTGRVHASRQRDVRLDAGLEHRREGDSGACDHAGSTTLVIFTRIERSWRECDIRVQHGGRVSLGAFSEAQAPTGRAMV
jgi:hypothetical protein